MVIKETPKRDKDKRFKHFMKNYYIHFPRDSAKYFSYVHFKSLIEVFKNPKTQ